MKSSAGELNFDPEGIEGELEKLEKAKSKMIMDFGLEQPKLERVDLEVLKRLIREKPDRMSRVIRTWLRPGGSNQ